MNVMHHLTQIHRGLRMLCTTWHIFAEASEKLCTTWHIFAEASECCGQLGTYTLDSPNILREACEFVKYFLLMARHMPDPVYNYVCTSLHTCSFECLPHKFPERHIEEQSC